MTFKKTDVYAITAGRMLQVWGVKPTEVRDWDKEVSYRVSFLKETLLNAGRSALVLGISGGVDSLVAGKLCQLAAESLRSDGHEARFIAMRLPYGRQLDEDDAQKALSFIDPDQVVTVNIQASVDAMEAVVTQECPATDHRMADFERGNVKARMRMVAQYQVSALNNGLVVGTDHNAEAVTGFFTKWGDGACDVLPLRGLNKRQVRLLAVALGASDELAYKPATADLEDLRPQLHDEAALGISYDIIDDFLEGKGGPSDDISDLVDIYEKTQHKRCPQPEAYCAPETE